MDLTQIFIISAVVIWSFMTMYYLLSLWVKDASVVDVGWGMGFVVLAWVMASSFNSLDIGHKLLTLAVTLWGFRLAIHILVRKKGKPEDWRYAKWRSDWGKTFWWRSYLQIFMLQGLLMFVISAPIMIAAANESFNLEPLVVIGFIGWSIGFFFETVGDYQLTQFIKSRKDKSQIMTTGLWTYTRHPNYFGEITVWWSIFVMVAGLKYGLWAIVSPITITYVLLKISGVMLEDKYKDNKQFQAYKRKTSGFFPWFPGK